MSKVTAKTWLNRFCVFGAVVYPLVAYVSIYFHKSHVAAGYLMVLCALYLLAMPTRRNLKLRLAIAVTILLGMVTIAEWYGVAVWLYFPPVLLPLWGALIFLSSLQGEENAVISRIARVMEGEQLNARHIHYTRAITMIWGVALLLMGIEGGLLAWLAPSPLWSWWVHIGNYLILLALLLIEIPVRWMWLGKGPQFGKMIKVMLTRQWTSR